ncbi:hypothetical protein CSIM01_02790 [Colletotrichum simmondsii]|uniref:Uncharacterized protein n=1 Tax=Colletotrichum simmondsii TaxID=703756 RepID=A0A135T1F5_9PEZI|nr:hypothetical protein CSIM01_02790 [Colletotrichum simmondsii]
MQVQELNTPKALPSSIYRLNTLEAIFGLSGEVLGRFPSIHAYYDYIESQMIAPVNSEFLPVWSYLSNSTSGTILDCWKFLEGIATAFNSAARDASFEDLKNSAVLPRENAEGPEDYVPLLRAVFAAVCWLTMTLQSSLDLDPPGGQASPACRLEDFPFCPDHFGTITQSDIIRGNAKQQVGWVFSAFIRSVGDDRPQGPESLTDQNDNLYEGSLTFEVLRFGRVAIQWVDSLSEHLNFDPNYVTLEQEVLVSYRLLFGQSARSRKMIKSQLEKLEKDNGQSIDKMLYTLCGPKKEVDKLPRSIWPVGCRDFEQEKLLESDVYSAQSDFPRLGYRLINLQRFSLRQKPRRLTDLWRDRRNPLQWYTFWAVLWVGGAGIILAIIQTVLAGVQVARS